MGLVGTKTIPYFLWNPSTQHNACHIAATLKWWWNSQAKASHGVLTSRCQSCLLPSSRDLPSRPHPLSAWLPLVTYLPDFPGQTSFSQVIAISELFPKSLVVQSLCRVFLWPNRLQHTRLSHPSPSPRMRSNSCPLSWWCHPTIQSVSLCPNRQASS